MGVDSKMYKLTCYRRHANEVGEFLWVVAGSRFSLWWRGWGWY